MSLFKRNFAADSINKEGLGSEDTRLSMSMRHAWFIIPFTVFLLLGIVGAVFYFSAPPKPLRFAVGPPGSEDARLVQALSQQFARDRASIRLTPVYEEGAAAAARALDDNGADLAIVRRDLAYPQSGQAIAELRENLVAIIVPAPGSQATGETKDAAPKREGKAKKAKSTEKPVAKPIEKIDDLEGRRIGVVGHSLANTEVLDVILKQYQIAPDKVTVVHLDPRDIEGSLRGHPVDAIIAIGPVASPVLANAIAASSKGKARPSLLKIGAAEAIEARYPVYESSEIKAGVLGGQSPLPEEAVTTISFKHYVVARNTVAENTVAEFTRLLFAARQSLGADYPVLAKMEKPDTDRDAAVPAHPGAAAFLDNDQKTFFDKYSDYLYFGLMLMSGLGSGLAWLLSYARADYRLKRLKTLDRLLAIVKAAREAKTVEELVRLREEGDAVLARTIRQVEANQLDESALMAFSLALDQAQLAIADRRAALALGVPPTAAAAPAAPPDAPAAAALAAPPDAPAAAEPTRSDSARNIRKLRKNAGIVPVSSS